MINFTYSLNAAKLIDMILADESWQTGLDTDERALWLYCAGNHLRHAANVSRNATTEYNTVLAALRALSSARRASLRTDGGG